MDNPFLIRDTPPKREQEAPPVLRALITLLDGKVVLSKTAEAAVDLGIFQKWAEAKKAAEEAERQRQEQEQWEIEQELVKVAAMFDPGVEGFTAMLEAFEKSAAVDADEDGACKLAAFYGRSFWRAIGSVLQKGKIGNEKAWSQIAAKTTPVQQRLISNRLDEIKQLGQANYEDPNYQHQVARILSDLQTSIRELRKIPIYNTCRLIAFLLN